MSEPLLGEIKMFSGGFAPQGWALCDGSLLPISGNYMALFAIVGTTYGGDGRTNFALPDFRGRGPVGSGQGQGPWPFQLGQMAGADSVQLTTAQLPAHSHPVLASGASGTSESPANAVPGAVEPSGTNVYGAPSEQVVMNEGMIGSAGGGQPVPVLSPVLCVNFIICVGGAFPQHP
jgi:microcystin-dependent protein